LGLDLALSILEHGFHRSESPGFPVIGLALSSTVVKSAHCTAIPSAPVFAFEDLLPEQYFVRVRETVLEVSPIGNYTASPRLACSSSAS
jgi:hypothetical protein